MGSFIEINDTLQITEANGFPSSLLNLAEHKKMPITIDNVKDIVFEFKNKPSARIFQFDPVRVYLVQNINDKWLFWGHALIQSQTIRKQLHPDGTWDGESWVTDGTYIISALYDPEYQKITTINESPSGLSYF